MSLKETQQRIDDWITQHKIGYFTPLEIMLRLTEEVGELAREVNHRFGPKKKKSTEETKEVGDEINDILFSIICLANSLDIDMDQAFDAMMEKIHTRDKNRWEKK